MVQYIQALEGFDRECEAMHTNIIMGEFMATESVGSSIKAGVQAAWEKLKKLVLGIWEKIKSFGRKIKSGVQAIIAMIRKSPDDANSHGKHIREMEQWIRANDDLAEVIADSTVSILKNIEDLRGLGNKLSKDERFALDEIERDLDECLSNYESCSKKFKSVDDEYRKARDEYDKVWKEYLENDTDETRDALHDVEHRAQTATDARRAANREYMPQYDKAARKTIMSELHTQDMMRQHGLDPNKNFITSKHEGAKDSYLGNESMEPATEAESGRKFSLSGLKQKLMSVLNRSEKATQASEQFINEVKNDFESIKNSASDERTANKKQSLLSKILNLGSRCFNFVKSIPGKIKEMFSSLWRFFHRPKSQVKPYNGPSPVAANDSYLYNPELAVEIG